jgi:CBS domain-containing protein
MSRSDIHLDAMLRHLGAAYYDSLYGRAAEADVTRAVEQVADRIGETPGTELAPAKARRRTSTQHHGSYHSRVRDVMTTSVVSVDRITPYKEIVALLAKHRIGGMPVLSMGRHVTGIVTDGDLVAVEARHAPGWSGFRRRRQQHQLRAEQLMTAPAITIHPDAPIASAARTMTQHHVHRLPVVDADGTLVGIVGRRDLLKLFLRPDEEIASQIHELISEVLPDDPSAVTVGVRNGVVTLTCQPGDGARRDGFRLAARLAADIDGVIDVVEGTASVQPA